MLCCFIVLFVTGKVDWADKSRPGETGPRTTRSLQCQIFVGPEEVEMSVVKTFIVMQTRTVWLKYLFGEKSDFV